MKIIVIAFLCFYAALANAGKGTNDLLLDANVAVRGMRLSEDQKVLLEAAIAKTKELPDVTSGTKKSFKDTLGAVIDNDKATFIDLVNSPINHFRGKLHDTVMGHYEIAVKWAKFDESLDVSQRLVFRTRMAETITKTFQSMTSSTAKLANIEDLSVGDYARRLDLTTGQKSTLTELFKNTIPRIRALDEKGAQATAKINKTLADPTLGFVEIPDAMLDFFKGLVEALEVKNDYGAKVFNELSDGQKKILTDYIRSRLKILRLVL